MFGFFVKWVGLLVVAFIVMQVVGRIVPGHLVLGTYSIAYSLLAFFATVFAGFGLTVK